MGAEASDQRPELHLSRPDADFMRARLMLLPLRHLHIRQRGLGALEHGVGEFVHGRAVKNRMLDGAVVERDIAQPRPAEGRLLEGGAVEQHASQSEPVERH